MFNRYVDGLATTAPDDPALYAAGAQRLVALGYVAPSADPGHEGFPASATRYEVASDDVADGAAE
jgi:hypothetical protein